MTAFNNYFVLLYHICSTSGQNRCIWNALDLLLLRQLTIGLVGYLCDFG